MLADTEGVPVLEPKIEFPYFQIRCNGSSLLKLFRKQHRPEDLGAMIYEALRSGMESVPPDEAKGRGRAHSTKPASDLSMTGFLQSLDRSPADLDEQYVGEIMVALMFGAALAIERSASPHVAEQIDSGMKAEFFSHILEQGASPVEKAEWEAVIADHFLAYRQCMEDYSGFEPPWRLGRQFYWNLIGTEEYNAMSIKIATLYMLTARDVSQDLLNEYGPTLLMQKGA